MVHGTLLLSRNWLLTCCVLRFRFKNSFSDFVCSQVEMATRSIHHCFIVLILIHLSESTDDFVVTVAPATVDESDLDLSSLKTNEIIFIVCGIVIVVLLCIIGVLLCVLLKYGHHSIRGSISGISSVPSHPHQIPHIVPPNQMQHVSSASFNSPAAHPIIPLTNSNLHNSMPLLHIQNGPSIPDLSIHGQHSNAVVVTELIDEDRAPDVIEEGSDHSESSSFSVDGNGAEMELQITTNTTNSGLHTMSPMGYTPTSTNDVTNAIRSNLETTPMSGRMEGLGMGLSAATENETYSAKKTTSGTTKGAQLPKPKTKGQWM